MERTSQEAQAALDAARKDDAAKSGHVEKLTVKMVFDDFIQSKELAGRAPATIYNYQWAADIACQRWGDLSAERLTHQQLDAAYVEMLAAGRRAYRRSKSGTRGTTTTTDRAMAARSVEMVHKTIRAAFERAVNMGYVVRNPAKLATPPRVVAQRRTWWTPEQVGAFLSYVDSLTSSPLPLALVDVLVNLGARRGEALGLRWKDVDLDAATVTITSQLVLVAKTQRLERRPTKRQRTHATVGLHSETVAALRRRRAEQAGHRLLMGSGWPKLDDDVHGDLVFTRADGTGLHPIVVSRQIARLSVDAGLPRITAHGLRHSFASAALQAREGVEVVAYRLGNTPRMVQEIYAQVIASDDHESAKRVGDLYRSAQSS